MIALHACAFTLLVSAAPKPLCMDPEMRERARTLMLQGIDDALKRHTGRVFSNWMKDDTQQPARAKAGMQHGVKAYVGSRQEAERWDPPRCGEE